MSISINYPNPVLSGLSDDYIKECKFDVMFDDKQIVTDDESINIPLKFVLVSSGLNDYIKNGSAAAIVSIKSSAAFYSKVFVFDKGNTEIKISIPKYSVKRSIEICGYIVAAKEITKFNCENEFNDLYFRNSVFNVKRGDVLAKGETRMLPVDNSELEKPISSIFQIVKNIEDDTPIQADFESDEGKIVIKLNSVLNQLYYDMKDKDNGILRRYLNGIIVFPVLIEAIAMMCESYQNVGQGGVDYSEKRWFRTIDHKLLEKGINLSESHDEYSYTELADKLLGGIALDGLNSVKTTVEQEANGGELFTIGGID